MAYNAKARDKRQCTHIIEKTGKRCGRWATYGTPDQKCYLHRKEKPPDAPDTNNSTRTHPCDCEAYAFPHRRHGGLCRWPDPPLFKWKGFQGKRSYLSNDSRAIEHNFELYQIAVKEMERRKKAKAAATKSFSETPK